MTDAAGDRARTARIFGRRLSAAEPVVVEQLRKDDPELSKAQGFSQVDEDPLNRDLVEAHYQRIGMGHGCGNTI
jgi:hypothetical protein